MCGGGSSLVQHVSSDGPLQQISDWREDCSDGVWNDVVSQVFHAAFNQHCPVLPPLSDVLPGRVSFQQKYYQQSFCPQSYHSREISHSMLACYFLYFSVACCSGQGGLLTAVVYVGNTNQKLAVTYNDNSSIIFPPVLTIYSTAIII